MATRFEIVLHGQREAALRAAGEEALHEIERLEGQLSLYRPSSEIALVNARASREAVRVSPRVFSLLEQARRLSLETDGAFDITIAPLVKCWGFMGDPGHLPTEQEIEEARSRVGMRLVELNENDCTVRFAREGVMLDLGAIGKGYAIEQAVELLREAGISSALIHGGTSSIYGLGHPPDAQAWSIAIHHPDPARNESLGTVPLRDEALSFSAVWGRSFEAEGETLGHVLDPRSGHPTNNAILSVVVGASPTETDALSTALLVRGVEGHDAIAKLRPSMKTLLVDKVSGSLRISAQRVEGFTLGVCD